MKDNLALFINILDKIWYARNQAIFEGKYLHVMDVIMVAQQSYDQYKDSNSCNKIKERRDNEKHKEKNKDNMKDKE